MFQAPGIVQDAGTFQQDLNTQKELYSSPYDSFNNVDSKLFTGYAGNTLDNFEYMLNRSKSSEEDLSNELGSIGHQFYNSRFVRQDPFKVIRHIYSNRDKQSNHFCKNHNVVTSNMNKNNDLMRPQRYGL